MSLAKELLELVGKEEKKGFIKLEKDVKTKSGETIPKGTQVKVIKKSGKKMTIESPDGLTAEVSI